MNENQQILNEIFLRNKVKGKYKFDYNLSKHSWFGIGGLVILWIVVRFIGPAAGWWTLADSL